MTQLGNQSVEDVLRDDLLEGDALIGTLGPILRHLLASDDHSLFSDEIVARVRGMLEHVSTQLLHAQADAAGIEDRRSLIGDRREAFVESFLGIPAVLNHVHALALEWQLTERLQARNDVDQVVSPLLQALISSSDAATAGTGMMALAAQARFVQSQRRMELPLCELPGDLFHSALITMRAQAPEQEDGAAGKAEAELRAKFDESNSRLGLIARLVTGMGSGAIAALSIDHAGAAIFLTALAIGSGQDRDLAVLSTNDRQLARLALSLRAAGLKPKAVEEQFLFLHPEIGLPAGFEQLGPDRAAALLSASAPFAAV
jgi:hypothetical protein